MYRSKPCKWLGPRCLLRQIISHRTLTGRCNTVNGLGALHLETSFMVDAQETCVSPCGPLHAISCSCRTAKRQYEEKISPYEERFLHDLHSFDSCIRPRRLSVKEALFRQSALKRVNSYDKTAPQSGGLNHRKSD